MTFPKLTKTESEMTVKSKHSVKPQQIHNNQRVVLLVADFRVVEFGF